VISAMYLPDMTATELLSSIRRLDTLENTHFMLISSESNIEALEPLRQSGVVAILPKPFDHANLQRAIRTTLQHIDPTEIELQNYEVEQLEVLLVDDSLVSRNHLFRVFQNMGINQIYQAGNGIEAIEMLKQQSFDLVVTDLNMPKMDGQALVEHIRSEMGNTFVPILVVTSEQNQTRLGQVEQAGVSAILDKPFEPESIREILYRVLDEQT
jgi:two-component system chemotaxis response regulator CheY